MNENILVYYEQSTSFACCIAYRIDSYNAFVAHIWEHLVFDTCIKDKKTLRNYVHELGGVVRAETTVFLTTIIIKIPYIDNQDINHGQTLSRIMNVIRSPSLGKNISKVVKETSIEELMRHDTPMVYVLKKLREEIYGSQYGIDFSFDTLVHELHSFTKTMTMQTLYFSVAADLNESDLAGLYDLVIYQDDTTLPNYISVKKLPEKANTPIAYEYCSSLRYIAILLLPHQLYEILLPFYVYMIFGCFSPFIEHLQKNKYIYRYVNGINYFNPTGIEFVTAVLPKDYHIVINEWKKFRNNASQYLSSSLLKKMTDSFLRSINLEWQNPEKKMKWISESYALFNKRITPNTFSMLLKRPDIIDVLPAIVETSPSYVLSIGANNAET